MRDYYSKRISPWWRRIAIAALAAVALTAAWKLASYGVQYFSARNLQQELQAEVRQGMEAEARSEVAASSVPEEQPAAAEAQEEMVPSRETADGQATHAPVVSGRNGRTEQTSPPEVRIGLAALLSRNSDLVGWLKMDALPRVDIPIVQRDHSYYLQRDFDGRANVNGTAFMDTACSIWPRSDNLIIYAHNMKNGEMFGGLQKLREEIFWRNKPMSTFGTLYDQAEYVPLAVLLCDLARGERYFNFTQTDFESAEDFDAYVARARELSDVTTPYDALYGDQLLTLVTCHGEAYTQRLLVILRRVREGEDRQVLAQLWR